MKKMTSLVLLFAVVSPLCFAQQDAAHDGAATQSYTAKVKRLSRSDVDALLSTPDKVLFIDLERPDQVADMGAFPAYLSILAKDLEKNLAFIPKDRAIVTVGLHARWAGRYGDLLASKGFDVAGAIGTEDYIAQGGVLLTKFPPRTAKAHGEEVGTK